MSCSVDPKMDVPTDDINDDDAPLTYPQPPLPLDSSNEDNRTIDITTFEREVGNNQYFKEKGE